MRPSVPRLKNMVEQALRENWSFNGVECRNSDIALTIIIWQRWYNVSSLDSGTVHLYRLFDLPNQDSVKRVRAVFQNVEHKYLPTNISVLKARGVAEEYWQEALGYRMPSTARATGFQTSADFPAGDDRVKLL